MKEEKRSLVFISYSTHNQDIAFEACDYLEAAGINCWIAPRNVVAGANYAGQIVSAIRNCDAFVLIASNAINESGHVSNEVSLAFDAKKDIIPFKIEQTEFSDEYLYFLGRKHWIDGYEDIGAGMQLLCATIEKIKAHNDEACEETKNTQPKESTENSHETGNHHGFKSDSNYKILNYKDIQSGEYNIDELKEEVIMIVNEVFGDDFSNASEALQLLEGISESWRIIINEQSIPVGYWVFVALYEDVFETVKQGKFDERDITLSNIDFIDLPGTYKGYLLMSGVKPEARTAELVQLVYHSLAEHIEYLAEQDIFFDEICAVGSSQIGMASLKKMGMKVIATYQFGGQVFYLDMKDVKKNKFFTKFEKLIKFYEDYFGSAEE